MPLLLDRTGMGGVVLNCMLPLLVHWYVELPPMALLDLFVILDRKNIPCAIDYTLALLSILSSLSIFLGHRVIFPMIASWNYCLLKTTQIISNILEGNQILHCLSFLGLGGDFWVPLLYRQMSENILPWMLLLDSQCISLPPPIVGWYTVGSWIVPMVFTSVSLYTGSLLPESTMVWKNWEAIWGNQRANCLRWKVLLRCSLVSTWHIHTV